MQTIDLLQCFSDQLARDDSLQDWPRRQAMQAVELCLNVFLQSQKNSIEQNVDAVSRRGVLTAFRVSKH